MCVMSVDINYLKNLICILHRARFDRPHTHSFTVTEEKLMTKVRNKRKTVTVTNSSRTIRACGAEVR